MFENRLTRILGTEYPLILGPMRRITLGEMAAVVSNCGAFGQIATGLLPPEKLSQEIELARSLTTRPFGINLPLIRKQAMEYMEIAIDKGVRVITTSAGKPDAIIERAQKAGIKVLHKVSSVSQGLRAQDAGADAVIAMGYEAGGHVGREKTTTFCLVPQLADALQVPVVAAGGVGDHRGLLAALALGAEGVEIGTRFLATEQCPVPQFYKQSILEAADDGTLLLGKKAVPVRVLRNEKTFQIQNPDQGQEDERVRTENDTLDYIDPRSDSQRALMMSGQIAGLVREVVGAEKVIEDMMGGAADLSAHLGKYFIPARNG